MTPQSEIIVTVRCTRAVVLNPSDFIVFGGSITALSPPTSAKLFNLTLQFVHPGMLSEVQMKLPKNANGLSNINPVEITITQGRGVRLGAG